MVLFFGKTGIHNHITVVQTVDSFGNPQKVVYVVAMDSADQGCQDTLGATDITLKQLRQDNKTIKHLYFKNDNASCYSGKLINAWYSSFRYI